MDILVSPRLREIHIRIQKDISAGKKNVTYSITGMADEVLMNSQQMIQFHGICPPLSTKIFSHRPKRGSWGPAHA